MKRLLTGILAVLLLLCGCSAPSSEGGYYTFTDSTGATVTLPEKPRRVAVLFSSYAEIWTLAGGTVSVTVGESIERGFVPEGTPLVDAGAGKTVDLELLLAYEPDFVIGSADIGTHKDACRAMQQAGIPAALFRVDTFAEYLNMLRICTDITENAQAYQLYGTTVAAKIDRIKEAVANATADRKQILFIRAGSRYSATKAKRAPDNFVCIMLKELGAYNIADNAPVLLDGLSLEEILSEDPDYIFLTTMGQEEAAVSYMESLFLQDGWRQLSAVQHNNYTFLQKDLFHFKPNARWAEAYQVLAELLYPEINFHE